MKENSKNLHEVVDIVKTMCDMQTSNQDCAIPFLRGAPGGGKTESIRALANENGYEFMSCHFALKQPEDIGGIPQFDKITYRDKEILSTKWSIPEILAELLILSEKAYEKEKKENKKCIVIFFLDDIHRCGPFHITALFELLSERKMREIKLPDNIAIVLAGNDSIKAGSQLTNSAIINRCAVLDVSTNFDYWKDNFAIKNDFNLFVLSFLENSGNRHFFHEEESIDSPWGSPRSWTKLSNLLNVMFNKKLNSETLKFICQAHVGITAGNEFVGYFQIINKFKIDRVYKDIIEQLKGKPLPEVINNIIELLNTKDEMNQYAFAHASLIEYLQKSQKERTKNKYIDVLAAIILAYRINPKNQFSELSIAIIKQLQIILINHKQGSKEFEQFYQIYDNMAKDMGSQTINELISEFLNDNEDE